MTINEARKRNTVRRIISILTIAAAMFLSAVPAQAHSNGNARVHNHSTSEVRIAVHNETSGRWLYPGATAVSIDHVFVPAKAIVYHYRYGRYQRAYGPGSWIHVTGSGPGANTFFAYRTW